MRKFTLAFAAAALLGTAALSVSATPAAAWHGWKGWHKHHHHHHFWRHRYYGPRVVYLGPCFKRVLVATPYGLRKRLVNVCY